MAVHLVPIIPRPADAYSGAGGGRCPTEARSLGKVLEVRPCDICRRVTVKDKLTRFSHLHLCRSCYRRYAL